jgi:hypothetical protein
LARVERGRGHERPSSSGARLAKAGWLTLLALAIRGFPLVEVFNPPITAPGTF